MMLVYSRLPGVLEVSLFTISGIHGLHEFVEKASVVSMHRIADWFFMALADVLMAAFDLSINRSL